MPPPREFIELATIARAYQGSRALTVAADLAIADRLVDGPKSAEELAVETGTHPPTLYRVLRALASIGVFHELDDRKFALNDVAEFLRSDHPLSVAPLARMLGADYEWKAWGELHHSVRTGANAAVHALGIDAWEYRRLHPEDNEVFDAAMRTLTRSYADEVSAYDFARHRMIADIGGGTGALIAAILQAYPDSRGILFDQPQVVANAAPVLEGAGVADRVELLGGNFFDNVPDGADAYILRRILHDWVDDKCVEILRCIRSAMTNEATLLVIEGVVGRPNEDPVIKFLDLMMLVSAGGRERTETEWRALLSESGFRLEQMVPATANSHLLVALPA
jgi:hypothetical protein